MKYEALIFDYFGVLSSEVASFWFQDYVTTADPSALKDKYVRPADKGVISEKELFNQLSALTGIPKQQIPEQWSKLLQVNDDLLSFIKEELVGKYKLGILTNATSEFLRTALKNHPLAQMFDAIVISSEIGYVKPEPEAYTSILQALSTHPTDALMIDDSPINVEGAKAVGMHALLFTSNNQLKKDLGF